MFSIFSYGYGTRNTKKLGLLATHGDGEPPKTLDAQYVKNIMYHFDNPEKTSFNLVMGVTMDQREYFRDYRLTQKGKLLLGQIHRLQCYAWNLCEIYDFTCCSENPKKHLPYNVSLVIMESYLRMLRVFIITMMFNKLKNLLLLRVLTKLLL